MSLYASFNGTLTTTIDEVESILTHTSWRYRGPHEIKAVGKSALLRGVTDSQQSKTVSSIRALAKAAQDLAQVANQSTQLINDAIGGHVLIRREPGGTNEILIMDHPDPDQAVKIWRWNMGGLGYSDNVTGADNPAREYDVAMTMDGAINANFITTGKLIADVVQIGASTTFAAGYDPTAVGTAARAYADDIIASLADGTYTGGTFISGTSVISPTVIGLQGTFAELMAGDPFGARLEIGESAGEPFLDAYDGDGDLRVKLLQDSLEFSAKGITGGKLEAEYFGAGGTGGMAGLLLSSTYSIKLEAYYYAWMESYGASVQCQGETVAIQADSGIYIGSLVNLKHPISSTANKQLDFTGGYALYRDAVGASGDNTRLWLDTPDFGEVVIGPRASGNLLGRLRIRTWDMVVNNDVMMYPETNGNGFIGRHNYAFAQMHSYSFVQASNEELKDDIESINIQDAYEKIKGLGVCRYSFKGKGDKKQLGIIAEKSPVELQGEGGKGIDLYSYLSLTTAAVQEVQARLEALEAERKDEREQR